MARLEDWCFFVVVVAAGSGLPTECIEGTCFANDGVYSLKVVRDQCQKITLLLLKSKSVRVIVPESCF